MQELTEKVHLLVTIKEKKLVLRQHTIVLLLVLRTMVAQLWKKTSCPQNSTID